MNVSRLRKKRQTIHSYIVLYCNIVNVWFHRQNGLIFECHSMVSHQSINFHCFTELIFKHFKYKLFLVCKRQSFSFSFCFYFFLLYLFLIDFTELYSINFPFFLFVSFLLSTYIFYGNLFYLLFNEMEHWWSFSYFSFQFLFLQCQQSKFL